MMRPLYAVYDFGRAPASYDFLTFLSIAGITAKNYGCDHVHVVFVQADNETGWRVDKKPLYPINKAWRRDNICVPLCKLIGATHSVCMNRAQAKRIIGDGVVMGPTYAGWMIARLVRHFPLPQLKVDAEAARLVRQSIASKDYITVTIRNTYADVRNSNLDAWDQFIVWAVDRGWCVIKVPDTEYAAYCGNDPLGTAAALNPLIRHALYAGAVTNLGVNNGPMQLCALGGLPFIMLKMMTTYRGTTEAAFARLGIKPGDKLPWATRYDQVCVWKDDTFENIVEAFRQTIDVQLQVA